MSDEAIEVLPDIAPPPPREMDTILRDIRIVTERSVQLDAVAATLEGERMNLDKRILAHNEEAGAVDRCRQALLLEYRNAVARSMG